MGKQKHTILILGASGFIGNAIYKELLSYFEVYATYATENDFYSENQVFRKYDVAENDITEILNIVQPTVIISALRGDYKMQFHAHKAVAIYVRNHHHCKLLYLSSVEVFDGQYELPSYETNKPVAESEYGKFKLSVERMLLEKIPAQLVILRLPMVLGVNSPRIVQLRQAMRYKAAFEVYPNLIISLTTADKIAQQIHYIINKQLDGVFHLSSIDMVHHEDLFRELSEKLGAEVPVFKSVFKRNDDGYLAILPKYNKLPKEYNITVSEVIEASTLKDEIFTLKN
ncbi:MAG: dTDP-4-dehydrorhamnose reductase [Candidatus Latescibacterota bacterium]|jgi:dTDP-4-dehydrorhamnose reductase